MLTSPKSEVSTEFIILIGITLVIFTSMITAIGLKNQDINENMIYSDAKEIADSIASEINTAARVEGYFRIFRIPDKISNIENYSVVINKANRLVLVKWDDKNQISSIATENIIGTVEPGTNKIRNDNGVIKIER